VTTGAPLLPDEEPGLSTRARIGVALLLIAVAIGAPFVLYPVFVMKVLCFALFACAYNLLFGYVGLLAFGHAAFFGTACYVTAYTAKYWGLTPELAVLAGTAVAALFGVVFGWLAIRRAGLYFAMITLALSQIIFFVALQSPWTGREDGLQGVPRGMLFGLFDLRNTVALYAFVAGVFLIGFFIVYRAVHSPFGHVLKAIRENEPRAISLGYDVETFKLLAFTLSAALSGLAGGTKTIVFQLASLTDVGFTTSGDVVLMVLIGGIGTLFGPLVGAAILIAMQVYLATFGPWVMIIQGSIFIACILGFRKGVVGTIQALLQKRRVPPPAALAEAAAPPPKSWKSSTPRTKPAA
jgi:branched-chain amino acid transport system permease protein